MRGSSREGAGERVTGARRVDRVKERSPVNRV